MKTLSIKQPYATLIAEGIKDIENRSFKTNFRGTILIHASSQWHDRLKTDSLFTEEQFKQIGKYNFQNKPDTNLYRYLDKNVITEKLSISSIIGQVDLIDCVQNHDSVWAESHNNFLWKELGYKPIYNWVLENAILYPEPILNVKGKLSFWEYKT